MTKIKICGLFQPCDVDYVNEARPDWCGFIINFPKSHRNQTPDQVRALRARLVPEVVPVGVFVDRPVEEVAELLNDGTITVAQLHGHEDEAYLAALRALAESVAVTEKTVDLSGDDEDENILTFDDIEGEKLPDEEAKP